MNKKKTIMTGVASALVCAVLITGSALAILAANANPMETAPIVTEAADLLANDLNVVAVDANYDTEGTSVLVQSGIVTVSGEGALTAMVGDDGVLVFEAFTPIFVEGVPGENDIDAETAVETAARAVQDKYALTDKTLARFTIEALLNVANSDEPVWSIVFNPANNSAFSAIGCYSVIINSKTGEIFSILSAADGIG
jgi:chaperonin GroEL (HSP60 family)